MQTDANIRLNMIRDLQLPRRLTVVALAVSGDLWCWLGLRADRAAGATGPGRTLADLIEATAAWTLQAALVWCTVLVLLVLIEPVAGGELTGWAACPPGLRHLLLLACGAVVVGAVTAPAHATEPPAPHPTTPHVHLDGLPLPDRTTDQHADPGSRSGSGTRITVREGDSLWRIAQQRLLEENPGRAPSDTEVDRVWRSWYAANRSRIGGDPRPDPARHPTELPHRVLNTRNPRTEHLR